ncbi:MAG: glycosyltransferase family 9 protein [Candidatus Adiutrix sp.]|jgi:ADP-heptose:LPS heptosyltransferase|nr:glycosyltransferase family 9 protein [Candidatus Adiutrix sp.]
MAEMIKPEKLPVPAANLTAIMRLEHLGDIIACEPVIRYAQRLRPGAPLAWIGKEAYFEALRWHPALDFFIAAPSLAAGGRLAGKLKAAGADVLNLHFNGQRCFDTGEHVLNDNDPDITWRNYFRFGPLLTAFCRSAGLPPLDEAPRFYIRPEAVAPPVAGPYVVFHACSNDGRKDWLNSKWGELADFLFARGLSVAEIGFKAAAPRAGHALYNDLTGRRSLQSLARLMAGADFFFGVDSGFAHLANALGVDGLVIMGRLADFTEHLPYTGFYAEPGHIVRRPSEPAARVRPAEVIEGYLKRMRARVGPRQADSGPSGLASNIKGIRPNAVAG